VFSRQAAKPPSRQDAKLKPSGWMKPPLTWAWALTFDGDGDGGSGSDLSDSQINIANQIRQNR
jgi:hypothetical protein